ncbi:MAG: DNA mismatch repair protein MutS [candidate division Zixibacteria bacterium]|nr:DNA mismatch repair protein MutS [candidate division Zixibacteria bacterium]
MKANGLTPMMRQYYRFKDKYPGKILFFRMGDFYEMFGEDAIEAAPILGIALTSRSGEGDNKIPLCGLPYHAVDKYLPKLIEAGKKVVICEQVEDPKQAKGIVKRDVVEIITPGTSTMESTLAPTQDSFLMAVCGNKKTLAVARLELSTGNFTVSENDPDTIADEIITLAPRELLYPSDQIDLLPKTITNNGIKNVTPLENIYFDVRLGREKLKKFFEVSTLDGFGLNGMKFSIAAAGAIFRYLEYNKQERLAHITAIKVGGAEKRMLLDSATVRNLELFQNLATGDEKHSFYWSINRTGSAGGARRLRRSVAAPFVEKSKIDYRQGAVAELFDKTNVSDALFDCLKKLPDIERLSGRLGMGKANPRTILAIKDAIIISRKMKELLLSGESPLIISVRDSMPELSHVAEAIDRAIKETVPLTTINGGIIKEGFSEKLDNLNFSIKDARKWIAGLAASERERTGIPSLKVGFNKVFGYFIEITKAHSDKAPQEYIRKQTLVNAERYITEDMKVKESLILEAEEKINRLEEDLFFQLAESVASELPALLQLADLLSEIDVVNSCARLVREENYVRPSIYPDRNLKIIQGRHPVLSQLLGSGNFVANDAHLNDSDTSLVILTGPNMSGKSTWLRQTGLIIILAQIGYFVPAEEAEIGIVDRVFTRVGATDSLTRGQSTFLVEMVETANILHNMTEKSLLLLDEVGRGTSTFDGLSIAWAVAESIHEHTEGTPRTLFATHYHEMTGLAAIYPRIENFQVTVKKWGQEIVFMHQIIKGGCDDSYGIEVARLAGLPRGTIKRAREILQLLESGKFAKSELARGVHVRLNQTSLFDVPVEVPLSAIEEQIRELDIDAMTPLEALEKLSELRKELNQDE